MVAARARPGKGESFLSAESIMWTRRPWRERRGAGASSDPGGVRREWRDWRRQVRDWRLELRTRGFAILRDPLTPTFVAAVRNYYRRLQSERHLRGRSDLRRGRPLLWDEPVLTFLGGQLGALVGQVTGEQIPSTFSFLRVYGPGAVLAPHRDRPACRWNIDLVVGGDPPPERRTAWPIWIEGRQGRCAVRLGLGDGLLYRGTELRHWRRAQPTGRTTLLACFHYGRAPASRG
jgi:hypothetical protein